MVTFYGSNNYSHFELHGGLASKTSNACVGLTSKTPGACMGLTSETDIAWGINR